MRPDNWMPVADAVILPRFVKGLGLAWLVIAFGIAPPLLAKLAELSQGRIEGSAYQVPFGTPNMVGQQVQTRVQGIKQACEMSPGECAGICRLSAMLACIRRLDRAPGQPADFSTYEFI